MPNSAVIITGPGFQDHDVVYTYYRLLEEGWNADVATKNADGVVGKYGVPLPMDRTAKPLISFDQLDVERYDAVILTGGHEAPDRVRQDARVLDFIRAMDERRKVIAGLCHGPWIMVSAGVLKDRRACAYIGLRDDVSNAGFVPVGLSPEYHPHRVIAPSSEGTGDGGRAAQAGAKAAAGRPQ